MAAIEDPKTLLLSDGSTVTLFDKVMGPVIYGFAGGFMSASVQWYRNKPIQAGFLRHVAFAAAGVYIGDYLFKRKTAYLMDRDAAYRHYIDLHPEDFPPPERVLLKDMLKPWTPCR